MPKIPCERKSIMWLLDDACGVALLYSPEGEGASPDRAYYFADVCCPGRDYAHHNAATAKEALDWLTDAVTA